MSEIKGPKKSDPQPFIMVRNNDETGNSGIGVVVEGCVFSDGWVAYTWRSGLNTRVWAESFEAFRKLHIDAHPENETEIIWFNPENEGEQND
ncbi:MAG TPA: hypothetical protein VMW36_05400 [Patescibacteria group bacterium]|nr:hypothetical protein [Patescibacteria group bacterium]